MTADIVNLRRHRKRKARDKRDKAAEQNRMIFGRSKAQKRLAGKQTKLDAKTLDGHKREP
jgi:hypothetical protein